MEKNVHCDAKADDVQPICSYVAVIAGKKIGRPQSDLIIFHESFLLTSHVNCEKSDGGFL